MKTLLIFLSISYIRGDKLNNLYLPPIGANGSGGLSGDIDLPFEVPVQSYFDTDKISLKLTEQERNKGLNGIGHSTHAPSVPSIIHPDNKSTISVSGGSVATKDNFSAPIDVNEDYNPNLLFDYNSEKPIPKADDKKDIDSIDLAAEIPDPSNFIKELSNYKGDRILPISNEQYISNYDSYAINVERDMRPQTEADRNAIVLNDKNVITPEGFSYSYDTSNGIHADESGTATNGVKAHGSYSYVGDDGKLYNVTYTADENGFRPKGDHLPTPPPIPEAILKVIEQAAIDKSNGIFDDGSYDENKYGYKKYENQNPKFSNLIASTRRLNDSYNKPENNEYANIVNSRVEIPIPTSTYAPTYAADGEKDNKEYKLNDQQTNDDYNKETANFNINKPSYNSDGGKENELEYATNRDLYTSGFPNIREENRLGYEYLSPKIKFVPMYRMNQIIIPESYNDFGNKSSPSYYVYDKYTPELDINPTPFLTKPLNTTYLNIELQMIVTDGGLTSIKNPDIDEFDQNPGRPPLGLFRPYTSPTLTPLYLPQGSTTTTTAPEVTYEVSEEIMPFGTNYPDLQSDSAEPSSTERIKQLNTNTNYRPSYLYGPSSSGTMNMPETYTERSRYFYVLPTTDRIKDVETYANRTNKVNGHSFTERIDPFGKHDDQLSDLYDNFSTERINSIGAYTDRIGDVYDTLSNERIKSIETFTDVPNKVYGLSSTERSFGENFAGPKQPQSYNSQTGENFAGPKQS